MTRQSVTLPDGTVEEIDPTNDRITHVTAPQYRDGVWAAHGGYTSGEVDAAYTEAARLRDGSRDNPRWWYTDATVIEVAQ